MSSPSSSVRSADSDCSPAIPRHFVAFAWRHLHRARLCAGPSGTHQAVDPGSFLLRRPHRLSHKERMSSPWFLVDVYMPCSPPRWNTRNKPLRCACTSFPRSIQRRLYVDFFRGSITRSAHPLCKFRSGGSRTTQNSVPVDGYSFPVRGLCPTGHSERFPILSVLDILSSFPGLCLAPTDFKSVPGDDISFGHAAHAAAPPRVWDHRAALRG